MNIKLRFYIYSFLLVVALAMLFVWHYRFSTLQSVFSERDYPQIHDEGVLRIATDYNAVDLFASGDSLAGFQYDLIMALSKLTPLTVVIVPTSLLGESLDALANNEIDVIARSTPITESILQNYTLSIPVFQSKIVLIQRKAAYNSGVEPLRNQLNLGGKTIVLPRQSPYRRRLVNLAQEISDTIVLVESEVYDIEQLAVQVASNEIDFTVCDALLAQKLAAGLPQIDIATDISFSQLNGWLMRQESVQLADSINTWLHRLKSDGTIDRLFHQYMEKKND